MLDVERRPSTNKYGLGSRLHRLATPLYELQPTNVDQQCIAPNGLSSIKYSGGEKSLFIHDFSWPPKARGSRPIFLKAQWTRQLSYESAMDLLQSSEKLNGVGGLPLGTRHIISSPGDRQMGLVFLPHSLCRIRAYARTVR